MDVSGVLAFITNAAKDFEMAKTMLATVKAKVLALPSPTDPTTPLVTPEDVDAAVQAGVAAAKQLVAHADAIDARLATEK